MLRSLGIGQALKWFVLACVAVAIWQAYDGNLTAIADALWRWVQAGADVVTRIWHSINASNAVDHQGGGGGGGAGRHPNR